MSQTTIDTLFLVGHGTENGEKCTIPFVLANIEVEKPGRKVEVILIFNGVTLAIPGKAAGFNIGVPFETLDLEQRIRTSRRRAASSAPARRASSTAACKTRPCSTASFGSRARNLLDKKDSSRTRSSRSREAFTPPIARRAERGESRRGLPDRGPPPARTESAGGTPRCPTRRHCLRPSGASAKHGARGAPSRGTPSRTRPASSVAMGTIPARLLPHPRRNGAGAGVRGGPRSSDRRRDPRALGDETSSRCRRFRSPRRCRRRPSPRRPFGAEPGQPQRRVAPAFRDDATQEPERIPRQPVEGRHRLDGDWIPTVLRMRWGLAISWRHRAGLTASRARRKGREPRAARERPRTPSR